MRPTLIFPFFIVILLSSVGCLPFIGHAKVPLSPDPIDFTDAKNGHVVEEVLVLPRYSSHTGASSGAGHGPEAMRHKHFVAAPFVYHRGEEFTPKQPRTVGVIWLGGAFTGRGATIDGVLVVAVGYEPKWVWNLWGRDLTDQFELEPIPSELASGRLKRLQGLLEKKVLAGEEKDLWSLGYGYELEVRLEREESAMIKDFIAAGVLLLEEKAGS